jgi:hypothetical protein
MGLGAFIAVDGRASLLVAIRNATEFCRNIDRWRDDFISAVRALDDAFQLRSCKAADGRHDFKTTPAHDDSVLEVQPKFKGVRALKVRG